MVHQLQKNENEVGMMGIHKNSPKNVSVDVMGKEVTMELQDKPLTLENLREGMSKVRSKADEVSEKVAGNWYPAGFVWLHVSGRSPLVKFFKKHGNEEREGYYKLEGVGAISKSSYHGGYMFYPNYPERNATESQSMNYKEPMVKLSQKVLESMGVESTFGSRMD